MKPDRRRVATIFAFTILLLSTVFLSIPAKASSSQSLPANCGTVGAQGYTTPLPKFPVVPHLLSGTTITVTTSSSDLDGDTSSVSALMKNPGPDGTISLREAIYATNNFPANYTIDFAPNLKGATITTSGLILTGGNLIINGDIDGDGKPDFTLNGNGSPIPAFVISSSGNTIYGLNLVNYAGQPAAIISLQGAYPNQVYRDNVISHLDITSSVLGSMGINLDAHYSNDSWIDTVIADNFVNVSGGIRFLFSPVSNSMTHTLIVNNTIIAGNLDDHGGIIIWPDGTDDTMLDSVVAYNTITVGKGLGTGQNVAASKFNSTFAMKVSSGGVSGNYSTLNGLQIIGNHVIPQGLGQVYGLTLSASGEGSYTKNNAIENVRIIGNTIGSLQSEPLVIGQMAGESNVMKNIQVIGDEFSAGNAIGYFGNPNTFWGTSAISVVGGSLTSNHPSPGSYLTLGPLSHGNTIENLTVQWNTLNLVAPAQVGVGFKMTGGLFGSFNNTVDDVLVTQNQVNSGNSLGVILVAGINPAKGNSISRAQMSCDVIASTENIRDPPTSPILVLGALCSGIGNTSDNAVNQVLLRDNLVAGVLNNVTIMDQYGQGCSGNTATLAPNSLTQTSTVTTTSTSIITSTLTPSTSTTTVSAASTTTVSTTSTTITTMSTSTSTTTSSAAISITFPTVSVTTPSATATSTATASTSSGGGGIPEFPFQLVAAAVLAFLVVASYLLIGRKLHPSPRSD